MKKKQQPNTEKELKKLAARIRGLRKKAGFTNSEYFAYENEMSSSQYSRYERGNDIRYSTLLKIIVAHGLTVEEFFSEGFE